MRRLLFMIVCGLMTLAAAQAQPMICLWTAVASSSAATGIRTTAKDNAIVFSSRDIHADDFDTIVIDRLKGEPFTEPLSQSFSRSNLIIRTDPVILAD